MSSTDGPVRHIALFRLASRSDAEGAAEFDAKLQSFVADLPDVLAASITADARLRPGHPRAFDRLLVLDFPNSEAARRYLASAVHERFVREEAVPRCDAVASIQVDSASAWLLHS